VREGPGSKSVWQRENGGRKGNLIWY
jgi:hypothetical protein